MSMSKKFLEVFGGALEANSRYGQKIKHPVTGEMVYEQQIRKGKTKKDRDNS